MRIRHFKDRAVRALDGLYCALLIIVNAQDSQQVTFSSRQLRRCAAVWKSHQIGKIKPCMCCNAVSCAELEVCTWGTVPYATTRVPSEV